MLHAWNFFWSDHAQQKQFFWSFRKHTSFYWWVAQDTRQLSAEGKEWCCKNHMCADPLEAVEFPCVVCHRLNFGWGECHSFPTAVPGTQKVVPSTASMVWRSGRSAFPRLGDLRKWQPLGESGFQGTQLVNVDPSCLVGMTNFNSGVRIVHLIITSYLEHFSEGPFQSVVPPVDALELALGIGSKSLP